MRKTKQKQIQNFIHITVQGRFFKILRKLPLTQVKNSIKV